MTRWQRKVRALIGLFGLTVGVLVLLAIRDRDETPGAGGLTRLDPEAVAESTGAVVTQARGVESRFRVEAERQLTYAGGTTRLEEVTVTVLERAGRDFVVTGREAEVGQGESAVTMTGDVRLVASDGLTVDTDRATYDDTEGLLRVPGRLRFERGGALSGSGMGATYDRNRDVLRLLEQARMAFGEAGGRTIVSSDTAILAQTDHYARFEGGVNVERQGRTMIADHAMAYLTEDGLRLRMVELRGGASIVAHALSPGGLESMRSEDMNLLYGGDGETLERATLVGGASVELAGPGAGRRISADWIDVTMAPGSDAITGLLARSDVVLDLGSADGGPGRRIRARTLEGTGDGVRGLTRARLEGDVQYVETAGARAAPARRIHGRALDLTVAPGFGEPEEARFRGDARFSEEDLSAEAPEILYAVGTGVVELTSPPGIDGRGPTVTDERLTVDADAITLTPLGRGLEAAGDVRSLYRRGEGGAGSDDAVRLPAMLTDDEPVYVSSQELTYDGTAKAATYTGAARLWQGDTAVHGDRIVLDGTNGNLTATGRVRSTMMLVQADETTGERTPVNTVATAGELLYEEAARRASYTTAARVNGPQGDLGATRIVLFLDEAGRELQRAEADEAVTLRDERRMATGDRLRYEEVGGRYTMWGTPVRIVEACRETTGQTLTFYRSTDTIAVDGNQEIRTQTKTGGGCP